MIKYFYFCSKYSKHYDTESARFIFKGNAIIINIISMSKQFMRRFMRRWRQCIRQAETGKSLKKRLSRDDLSYDIYHNNE